MTPEGSDPIKHANSESVGSGTSETSFDDGKSMNTPLGHNPQIVYKVQYKNDISEQIVYTRESEGPVVVESNGSKRLPVLELITNVHTNAALEKDEQLKEPPQTVLSVERPYLKINSSAIINALQKVVEYYPEQDFSGESIEVSEPFNVLIHHESELAAFRETHAPGKIWSEHEYCAREKNTYEHLGILQNFLKQRVGVSVETEKLRYKRGFATFDMLWMLLKPGITVYCDTYGDGRYDAYVIESVRGDEAEGPTSILRIDMWYLNFDGKRIGRRGLTDYQKRFNDEKRISTLEVFPCEFWEDKSAEKNVKRLRESLEERGRMFFKLTSRRCMSYDGLTVWHPKRHVCAYSFNAFPEPYCLHVSSLVQGSRDG